MILWSDIFRKTLATACVIGVMGCLGLSVAAASDQSDGVGLTPEEKAFVASSPPIKVCVDPDWEPFEILTSQGKHVGIAADLLRLVAERTGLKLNIVRTLDWDDSILASKDGRCHVLSFLNQSPKRDQWLIFTQPIFRDVNVFITREEHLPIVDPATLSGETIAFPRGTAMEEMIRRDYPNLNVITTDSEAEAIAMVNDRRADMTMRSLIVAAHVIKKEGWFNLKIAGRLPNYENRLRIGVVKDKVMVRDILDKGVRSITQQDTDSIVNKFVTIQVTVGMDQRWFYALGGVFFILLSVGGFWAIRLRRANLVLAQTSQTDTLTGLPNRGHVNQWLAAELDRCRRNRQPFSVLVLDLDHFKQINDTFGHLIGDQVLIQFTELLRSFSRSYDLVGRWGGEEFVILCPQTGTEQAQSLAERICQATRSTEFATNRLQTVSIGVAEWRHDDTADSILHRADQALYRSKRQGRDCVTVYGLAGLAAMVFGLACLGMPMAAQAQDSSVKVRLGGYSKWWAVGAWSDHSYQSAAARTPTNLDVKGDSEIHVIGQGQLPNGAVLGLKIELEAGGHTDMNTDPIDKSFVWIEGRLGKVSVGSDYNAASLLHVCAPDAANSWNGPSNGVMSDAAISRPSAVSGRYSGNQTELDHDDNAEKITYFTPSWHGLTVGGSYTPSSQSEDNRSATAATEIYSLGFGYQWSQDDLSVALSGGAMMGDMDTTGLGQAASQFHALSAGAQVTIGSVTIGGSYGNERRNYTTGSFDVGATDDTGYSWDVGVQYETGPYAVSVAHYQSWVKGLVADDGRDHIQAVQISGKYQIGPGLAAMLVLGHIQYQDESGPDRAANNNSGVAVMSGLGMWF